MNNKCWLEAEDVTAYKNGYKVVKNLTLKCFEDERIIILGPNGSGKSSIIDLINRNIYPVVKKNSYFKIFNKEIINLWELRKYISTANNEIKLRINTEMKVIDILVSGLYGKFCNIKETNQEDLDKANELIYKMDLQEIAQKKFGYLSDGEKQICVIARSIINRPKILILDEPGVNIDLKSKFFLINKIKNLSKFGITILCITHDISLITKDYNRVIFLKDRKIFGDGKPSDLMNSKNINNLFNINITLVEGKDSWDICRQ